MNRSIARMMFAAAALSFGAAAHAAAVFESLVGDVRLTAAAGQKPAAVKPGQRIASGATIVTGSDGFAVLKFDDEQKIALMPNSELAVVDFHYNPKLAAADRAEMVLNRGGARVVTGHVARRNQEMFVLRTPHVNLGVRGTDFSTTIVGNSYWSVNDGAVAASTNVGTGVYGKGSYGRSQGLDRLATGLSAAGLPVAVLALFNELNSAKVTAQLRNDVPPVVPVATGATAAGEFEKKSGGLSGGTIAVLAAIVAALAAAAGGGGGGGGGGVTPTPSH